MNNKNNEDMTRLSADIRIWTIRGIASAGFGHIGGSASIADVLGVLYGGVMKIDPKNPKWEDRDWLILSKGHCAPALYAALAIKGYFPIDKLKTLNQNGTDLPSHADMQRVPGVDMSTGSLGQGLSNAVGICYAHRYFKRDNWTYCICGDGECNEGQIWEACETANSLSLDRLIVFIDWNKKQLDGKLEQINDPVDLECKFKAFGFDTITVKGYDTQAIFDGINQVKMNKGKPHCILLDTIKGLGVTMAEEAEANHYLSFGPEEGEVAVAEIKKRLCEGTYPGGDFKW